jgi:hypothetical protein
MEPREARRKRKELFASPVKEVCSERLSPILPTIPLSTIDRGRHATEVQTEQSTDRKSSRAQLLRLYAENDVAIREKRDRVQALRRQKAQYEAQALAP